MKNWLRHKLDIARVSLIALGVPDIALKNIRIETFCQWTTGRAFVVCGGRTVYVAIWWAWMCRIIPPLGRHLVGVLRHEIGHVLVNKYPTVAQAFKLPEYPTMGLWYVIRTTLQQGYRATCLEEGLCEKIRGLELRTIRKLTRAIRGSRA